MWLFRHKHLAYGTLSCYKARLVTNGSKHLSGFDVDETFSLVVKPDTIWTVLSLATSRHWPVHQLDVKKCLLTWPLGLGFSALLLILLVLGLLIVAVTRHYLSTARVFPLCLIIVTPVVDTEFKLGYDGDLVSYLTLYQSLTGALQCLTFTRNDIYYAVQQVCLYMHDPREPHFSALKLIL
ncbi:ribonuclease H-like domain-containing protein, partial [Tanacetum coccineum]